MSPEQFWALTEDAEDVELGFDGTAPVIEIQLELDAFADVRFTGAARRVEVSSRVAELPTLVIGGVTPPDALVLGT